MPRDTDGEVHRGQLSCAFDHDVFDSCSAAEMTASRRFFGGGAFQSRPRCNRPSPVPAPWRPLVRGPRRKGPAAMRSRLLRRAMMSRLTSLPSAQRHSNYRPSPITPSSRQLAKVRRNFADHDRRRLLRNPEFLRGERDADDRRSQTQIDEARQFSNSLSYPGIFAAKARAPRSICPALSYPRSPSSRPPEQSRSTGWPIVLTRTAIFGVTQPSVNRREMMACLAARPQQRSNEQGANPGAMLQGIGVSQASKARPAAITGGKRAGFLEAWRHSESRASSSQSWS